MSQTVGQITGLAGLAAGRATILALLLGGTAFAQPPEKTPARDVPGAARAEAGTTAQADTVVVFGRAAELIGSASAASEGVVGYADFETRPLLRPGELVEVIPGMVAAQHSGGGKANQYFLRGFNLDHGTDFAASIDGAPLNLRAHPHMNGYLDLNFMIPETIEKVRFYKGVGYAQNGDFSAAGAADFTTYDRSEENYLELNASTDGDQRALIVGSADIGEDGTLLYAGEHEWGNGPFERPEDLRKWSGFLKYTQPLALLGQEAKFRASLIGYDNSWYATDQMPLRAIQSGLISRFGTLDPDLGGKTSRMIASAGLTWDKASLLVYGESYSLRLFNNPTFFIDPVRGDAFVQTTDRTALGARGQVSADMDIAGIRAETRLGADIRTDFIDRAGLQRTIKRIPFSTIRDDKGSVTLADIWADATVRWTSSFRTTLGARLDHILYDFTALQPENSGNGSDTRFSPKFAAALTMSEDLEAYASYGYAFHTNDARGALTRSDPLTGDPVTPSPVFVASRGGEAGLRWEPHATFNLSASLFQLALDSELIFVGDAGTSEPSDATRREGVEISSFWQPFSSLAIDVSGAWSRARFQNAPADAARIPNAVEFVGSAGVTFTGEDGWEASVRLRYIGEAPLLEDNSVRGASTFTVNAGVSKDFGPVYAGLDILNLTNSRDNEIQYFYASRLPGEAAPVEDLMIHPLHPRSLRLVVRVKY